MRGVVATVCLAFLAACAGSVRPVEPTDLVGGGPPATRVTVRVKQTLEVDAPLSLVYVLLEGEYRPRYADAHGVYFASPSGVLERSGDEERTLAGGLHLPNAGGQYYSFPSLYVELSEGEPRKLALPDELRSQYGQSVVFAVEGVEQRP